MSSTGSPQSIKMVLPRPRRLSGIDMAPAEPENTQELGATMVSGACRSRRRAA